jgi:hypothetical protein
MISKLERMFAIVLIVLVTVLTVTAVPSWGGHPIEGFWLLLHMAASGAMVFVLPIYAVLGLIGWSNRTTQGVRTTPGVTPPKLSVIGFWGVVAFGLATIATVFVCMLPIPSTDQMHQLVAWHGWAGYAMAIAGIVLIVGWIAGKK